MTNHFTTSALVPLGLASSEEWRSLKNDRVMQDIIQACILL